MSGLLEEITAGENSMNINDEKDFYTFSFALFFMFMLMIFLTVLILSSCCTLEFSNVMTAGTASDVVDDDAQIKSDPDLKFQIPVKP
jgi:hypothetical protein